RSIGLRTRSHGGGVRAAVHALLHHQAARNRAGAGHRAIGGERPSRAHFGFERIWPGRDVHNRAAEMIRRLLIIDDDPNTLASLSRAFRMAGHEAEVADNAGRALALI